MKISLSHQGSRWIRPYRYQIKFCILHCVQLAVADAIWDSPESFQNEKNWYGSFCSCIFDTVKCEHSTYLLHFYFLAFDLVLYGVDCIGCLSFLSTSFRSCPASVEPRLLMYMLPNGVRKLTNLSWYAKYLLVSVSSSRQSVFEISSDIFTALWHCPWIS